MVGDIQQLNNVTQQHQVCEFIYNDHNFYLFLYTVKYARKQATMFDNMPGDNPVYMLANESGSTSVIYDSITNLTPSCREEKQEGDEEERVFVNPIYGDPDPTDYEIPVISSGSPALGPANYEEPLRVDISRSPDLNFSSHELHCLPCYDNTNKSPVYRPQCKKKPLLPPIHKLESVPMEQCRRKPMLPPVAEKVSEPIKLVRHQCITNPSIPK